MALEQSPAAPAQGGGLATQSTASTHPHALLLSTAPHARGKAPQTLFSDQARFAAQLPPSQLC